MKIIELLRLVRKHLVLLIIVPLSLATLVMMLTRNGKHTYASSTKLYTGLATGSTIEMDKTFNYFLTNTAFDNLLNIINSRETQEEVAIRLLSQHLSLQKENSKFISAQSFKKLREITPTFLYSYVVKSNNIDSEDSTEVLVKKKTPLSFVNQDNQKNDTSKQSIIVNVIPASVNKSDYEMTVKNLTELMRSSDSNFVYQLLNHDDSHYSIKAMSSIKAERIGSSDMIRLSYVVDDPGICQQTLAILNEVCIKNYKNIKENRSDAVVKYFESQLDFANLKLKDAEDKLLVFNKSNNIINYYEQSKAVAVVKEDMEVDYNNKKAQLAGIEAAIKRLEEKLGIQQQVQSKNNNLLEKKKQLGDINFEIATTESESTTSEANIKKIAALKKQSENLKSDIKKGVQEVYSYQNTVDGIPVSTVLTEWINNVVEAENLRAKLKVMDQRNKDFQQQYSIYAPAGANIKRIEREISVSEQGYLEILHGLNLAKLKLQDNALASNLKAVDPPFFPVEPEPSKTMALVIGSAFLGLILVLGNILAMEYFDDTLKNSKRASKILQLPSLGMIPKIFLKPETNNFSFINNRLLEIATQNLKQYFSLHDSGKKVKTILFLSTLEQEGKTVLAGNISRKLIEEGNKVLILNFSKSQNQSTHQGRYSFLSRLLGYHDSRINIKSPFLDNPTNYLPNSEYFFCKIDNHFYSAKNYGDILEQNNINISYVPDYVFIEIPAIIFNNYPADLIAQSDLSVLICRANRLWSEADQTALNELLPLSGNKMAFIVNGVELQELESLVGELPKKSSKFRKKLKNLLRFQFFSKNQI
jgi:polysaccharide biosynthesis transport protein